MDAVVALTRFGLGPRPGERETLTDPRQWLLDQVAARPLPLPLAKRPSTRTILEAVRARRRDGDRRDDREAARALYELESATHLRWRVDTDAPFAERWIACWSNHFTVSVTRRAITAFVAAFERDVVRRHAFGRFADLLLASTRHPAMLLYLDNERSIGPDSPAGRRKGGGLNENLAREILELHTLGADGGYTQADVEALARLITGWSLPEGDTGDTFAFRAGAHQPGEKTLLGVTYPEGERGGVAALEALAKHPSTARHVAKRLCRHFVADDPPEAEVARLAEVFTSTDGDLAALARAVIDAPTTPRVRRASDYVTAVARLLGGFEGAALLRAQVDLGEAPWGARSPAGWSDLDADQVGPQAVLDRIELARKAAARAEVADPFALAQDAYGPALSHATAKAVRSAPSASDGLALLLASPEMQRR